MNESQRQGMIQFHTKAEAGLRKFGRTADAAKAKAARQRLEAAQADNSPDPKKQKIHDAYIASLDRMRGLLQQLQDARMDAIGDGTLSKRIDWAHVGSLQQANIYLEDALRFAPRRVK